MRHPVSLAPWAEPRLRAPNQLLGGQAPFAPALIFGKWWVAKVTWEGPPAPFEGSPAAQPDSYRKPTQNAARSVLFVCAFLVRFHPHLLRHLLFAEPGLTSLSPPPAPHSASREESGRGSRRQGMGCQAYLSPGVVSTPVWSLPTVWPWASLFPS